MARFSYEESENYKGGGGSFFSLKDDKDTARVRFLLNDINDLLGVSTHEIKINDKRIDVECIREYNEPLDKCPLCAAGYKVHPKLFIPVYNEDAQASQIWTRGRTYFDTISGLCSRYGNPLVGQKFEIERQGKKGDTSTKYGIYAMGAADRSRVEDFPEIDAEGVAFETHTYEELENFLDTGDFGEEPIEDNRRQTTDRQANNRVERQVPMRRRPVQDDEEDNF